MRNKKLKKKQLRFYLLPCMRNIYCSICSSVEKAGVTTRAYVCFKNWSVSWTAIEAYCMAEGFQQLQEDARPCLQTFIGYGNSCVFSTIRQMDYGFAVDKIECTNHLVKNYKERLYNLKTSKKALALSAISWQILLVEWSHIGMSMMVLLIR